ncbi:MULTISPECIES: hypothetical protein [unclassified Arsukibacterium]|uniref:hypothetical protein n=1 Tax=unclassified Arsukibacterium TaxID=2635278 RepID=UPI000C4A7661|nr:MULTISPECIES: hypothetical protein [unclassified Arsukibacterium]MAA93923.1 hypothetical protein [Rheinheimera sp.]MBM35074.1 hypothetical protein [Rheinheimera sp.]HAW92377.1 hypothetical protein [Candidatus Azambacteria bacterium]|tara:strand:+ start:4103 stop:4291 length:189 start_codon:yes stop_codon:yes gene_type:complete
MSVSKQSDVPQHPFFYPQNNTVDLTRQERTALSLVWNDNKTDTIRSAQDESGTAHCAVLGYN